MQAATAALVERVRAARADKSTLAIQGGGSKAFYGEAAQGQPLDVTGLTGISSYEPSELVVTVGAGTPLAELEAALAAAGQCLPFEPPRFAVDGVSATTVGGMVAAGLAGPARAAVGGVRDYVLGATLLNGRAELLAFGGTVMKNVAGYDVSRALAGSMGCLGVICQVSLKVLPVAQGTVSGLQDVPALQRQAALSLGLSGNQSLRYIGIPLALPVWLSGVRTSIIINIGTAAIASTVGAKTLGSPIIVGLSGFNTAYILQGALVLALLAITVDMAFEVLARRLAWRG